MTGRDSFMSRFGHGRFRQPAHRRLSERNVLQVDKVCRVKCEVVIFHTARYVIMYNRLRYEHRCQENDITSSRPRERS
jgi:hypothetical protein